MSVPLGSTRLQKLVSKAAGALGFRGYPGVSVGFGGQISCKSQGSLTLGSQFLGFSWVSGGIRLACGQITCKLQMTGNLLFRVSIPWVFLGIRGYPLLLAPQGCKS